MASPELDQLHRANEAALQRAVTNQPMGAYVEFKRAVGIYNGLDESDPDVRMAGVDTLRDWAMTYARDASHIDDPVEQALLFRAAGHVIDAAYNRANPLVIGPADQYKNKKQTYRGLDTRDAVTAVEGRINTLQKVADNQWDWGDEPAYGRAYAGLKRQGSYWAVAAATQPLRYIMAKPDRGDYFTENKSTILHALPWLGRTAISLAKTVARNPFDAENRRQALQSMRHIGMILGTSYSREAARASILERP